MKVGLSLVIAIFGFLSSYGFAVEENVKLAALMRGLRNDMGVVIAPLKVPAGTEVTDAMILDAMLRTKTARYLLTEFQSKAGKVQEDKLVKEEFTPIAIQGLSGSALTDALAKIATFSTQVGEKFAASETAYETELAKVASERNFAAVAKLMKEAQALQKEAHTLFNP